MNYNNNRKKIIITDLVILVIYILFEFLVSDSYKYYPYFMWMLALPIFGLSYLDYKENKK
jgi:hypothetical protein